MTIAVGRRKVAIEQVATAPDRPARFRVECYVKRAGDPRAPWRLEADGEWFSPGAACAEARKFLERRD